ncbi:MAG: bifunctional phosphoribosylaminoimidazolecarboxamide formyltransferase/IMP cyclohydrolase, partial [Firmicutes bacterium]|nr:bifunctional phosphoribosylaminoimidazolecarboxamide formyltransferase/IMP cyclohydrolase [Bacillota bacterium]
AGELLTAYQKAYQADPVSIFGGILALNRRVEGSLAREINKIFAEIVLAPGFSPEALEVFRKKKDLRLLEIQIAGESLHPRPDPLPLDLRRITGGFLLQEQDLAGENPGSWQRVAGPEQPEEVLADLLFAWKVVKHARSNAIVVAQAGQTLGIGSGQTNRIDAARQALERARSIKKGMLDQAVLASDAFFPFPDVVEAAGQAGIRALVQPGGSVRDEESIALAERLGISMYFTGRRHFRH